MNISVRNGEEVYDSLYDEDFEEVGDDSQGGNGYPMKLSFRYEPAHLPFPFNQVHLTLHRKGELFYGIGIISAIDEEVFEGDSRPFIRDIDSMKGYSFLSTRKDRFSGYVLSNEGNRISIERFSFQYHEGDKGHPAIGIQLGTNGTNPIPFPKSLDDFLEQVDLLEANVNLVLRHSFAQNMKPHDLEYYAEMEMPLNLGSVS